MAPESLAIGIDLGTTCSWVLFPKFPAGLVYVYYQLRRCLAKRSGCNHSKRSGQSHDPFLRVLFSQRAFDWWRCHKSSRQEHTEYVSNFHCSNLQEWIIAFRIFDVKRLIGRKFNDPEVQADIKHFPFKVLNKDGRPQIQVEYRGESVYFVSMFFCIIVAGTESDMSFM